MMQIPFSKYHGLSNDYLFIDAISQPALLDLPWTGLAKQMSNRRLGPGSDGIVILFRTLSGEIAMRIFNSDGSEAENCGNALRCVARLCHERGLSPSGQFPVHLVNRTAIVCVHADDPDYRDVTVNIGRAIWEREALPMTGQGDTVHIAIAAGDRTFDASCLSVGNPHCVLFVTDISDEEILYYGPMIEHHRLFPQRINVGFCSVLNPGRLKLTVWERGAGLTGACGTGATAAFAAATVRGLVRNVCHVEMPGGVLAFQVNAEADIFMSGPADHVYDGLYPWTYTVSEPSLPA
ncbi:diaminopimelate epimerase [bacterium]|nr:diaminopimelate epimerase [candidate division CSSED10-310 bacterium]